MPHLARVLTQYCRPALLRQVRLSVCGYHLQPGYYVVRARDRTARAYERAPHVVCTEVRTLRVVATDQAVCVCVYVRVCVCPRAHPGIGAKRDESIKHGHTHAHSHGRK